MAKPKLQTAKDDFIDVLDSSDGLLAAVRPFLEGSYQQAAGEAIQRKQAERILALAFMASVAAWEEFVLGAFIRYMVGVAAPSGYKPTLRLGACGTLNHALEVVSGKADFNIEKRYISWKGWDDVLSSAKVYFRQGAPFDRLTAADIDHLKDATSIRNRVAHKSPKCIAQFVATAKKHMGVAAANPLPQGTDPGRLLASQVTHLFTDVPNQTYYEAYSAWLRRLANLLVP